MKQTLFDRGGSLDEFRKYRRCSRAEGRVSSNKLLMKIQSSQYRYDYNIIVILDSRIDFCIDQ